MAAITLSGIQSDVRSRVNDEEGRLSSVLLTHWANIAQNVVYNQLLPVIANKMSRKDTVAISVVGEKYVFPVPLNREIKRITIGGKKARRKTFDEIDSTFDGFDKATLDSPVYLEWGGTVELFPVCGTGGFRNDTTMEIFSLRQITPMTEETPAPTIPEEYHGLIVDYVESMALRKLGRVDAAINAETMQTKMYTDILNATVQGIMLEDAKKERT